MLSQLWWCDFVDIDSALEGIGNSLARLPEIGFGLIVPIPKVHAWVSTRELWLHELLHQGSGTSNALSAAEISPSHETVAVSSRSRM